MSTKSDNLFHPINGTQEETWYGFSWPAFFFGIIWMLIKGLYAQAVISIIISIVTAGFAIPVLWIVYGFMGNELHKKSLLKKGYLTKSQHESSQKSTSNSTISQASPHPSSDSIDRLTALAKLRESGALTQEEFDTQKGTILGTA
ncbi:MAG: SHOCT domain-containing protein [Rhodoferax sp.]|uniref:SHOCT domain-containing protein n=1 Tax=Rhodoferax sp. TaxID=50421 RepID=UPI00261F3E73|nr:SHOCT domain-containing protein [Rhodoferax sp.]MDD2880446.1 SHOCT domain-containing protein [Rhodoferax sp.]